MTAVLAMCFAGTAHAKDNCNDLDNDLQWRELFQEFSVQFKGGDYTSALKTTEKLQEICTRSPILNYSIAQTYQKLDNRVKAVQYFQKATEYADEFQVKGKILEMLWYSRYEAEHPEIAQKQSELADRQQELENLNAVLAETTQKTAEIERASEKRQANELNTYKALMWTGISVGAAGLASSIAGGVLMALNKDDSIDQSEPGKVRVKYIHNVGIGLLSAGIVATVTGAIAASFGGYLYYRFLPDEDTVSLQINPTSASLTYHF